jgi:predicted RecA/RadA family phage recombinase
MPLTVDFTGGATLLSGATAPVGEEFKIQNTITKTTAGSDVTAAARSYDGIPKLYTLKRRVDTSKTGGTNT